MRHIIDHIFTPVDKQVGAGGPFACDHTDRLIRNQWLRLRCDYSLATYSVLQKYPDLP